ncbi:hypothetical protein QTP86_010195, partial [Hemibagrus guttatus]
MMPEIGGSGSQPSSRSYGSGGVNSSSSPSPQSPACSQQSSSYSGYNQLQPFVRVQNNLHDPNQSGFKAAHSTETALLAVTEKLHASRSAKLSSVLILLDLSAAFDTVNHKTLNPSKTELLVIPEYQRSLKIDAAIIEMIAIDNQPFSLASDVGFKRHMSLMEPRPVWIVFYCQNPDRLGPMPKEVGYKLNYEDNNRSVGLRPPPCVLSKWTQGGRFTYLALPRMTLVNTARFPESPGQSLWPRIMAMCRKLAPGKLSTCTSLLPILGIRLRLTVSRISPSEESEDTVLGFTTVAESEWRDSDRTVRDSAVRIPRGSSFHRLGARTEKSLDVYLPLSLRDGGTSRAVLVDLRERGAVRGVTRAL